jgi:hypothetical protein
MMIIRTEHVLLTLNILNQHVSWRGISAMRTTNPLSAAYKYSHDPLMTSLYISCVTTFSVFSKCRDGSPL